MKDDANQPLTTVLTTLAADATEPERTAARRRRGRRGNGEGSICQRSDGRWAGYVSVSGGGRKWFYGHTRAEVVRKLAGGVKSAAEGVPFTDETNTLGRFLSDWIETSKTRIKPSTYESYLSIINVHLIPALGERRIARLTPQMVQALMAEKLEAGLSPRRVAYIRAVLRKALNDAMRWGIASRNVVALVEAPRSERHEIRPFTAEEAHRFLAQVKGDPLEALYVVAISTGLRQGELLGLQWDDVDLEEGVLHVRNALQRIDGEFQLVSPKSSHSRRTVPLPAIARTALATHAERTKQGQATSPGSTADGWNLIFRSSSGKPMNATTISHSFHRHLTAAGLRDQRFHDLRHACASFLLSQGANPRVVMELLGHSQISLTLETYSHVHAGIAKEAAARLDQVFGG